MQLSYSPLRILLAYRNWYISTMSDPYYNMDIPGHFFDFLVYIELFIQFPLAVYILPRLFDTNLSGTVELAAGLYGVVTALCTALVCNDMLYLGPDIIDHASKQTLLFSAYLPFAIFGEFELLLLLKFADSLSSNIHKSRHVIETSP